MKLFTLLLLFSLSNIYSQEAEYFIEYSFVSIHDTIANNFSSPDSYVLYKVKNQSRFMSEAQYYNDSLNAIFLDKHPSPTVTKYTSQAEVQRWVDNYIEHSSESNLNSRSSYFVHKNTSNNNCIVFAMNTYPQHYLQEDVQFDWVIENERQLIQGIECIKASCSYGGRNYDAWFAPSIPINDGPYVFRGLPGLIVKIEDDQSWYLFELVSAELRTSNRFWNDDLIHKNYIEINRKEYVKLMFKELTNPNPPFGILGDTEELKLKIKEKNRTRLDLIIERSY